MSLVGFKAQNHGQQVRRRGANPKVDDRQTAPEVFAALHKRFRFTVDVAASAQNKKLERFYTPAEDGLAQPWGGERVWCNPPYSSIEPWVEKAWAESQRADLIVMLLPANRTEQGWWQRHVESPRRRREPAFSVEFLAGRMRFIAPDALEVKPNERPPFGVCLLIWDRLHGT
ncbi:MAG: DNA N-6-adenine-methyltransferase [Solirubrobacteraceae bacterium]